MIQKLWTVPVTRRSHPFGAACQKCNFDARNYLEEEYFFSGTANVYGKNGSGKAILYPDAPYTNRFLLRMPKDIERCSGRIVFEMMNSSNFFDLDRMWMLGREHFMRNGDIYIGITAKPNILVGLMKFDPQRYTPLTWANPREKGPFPATGLADFKQFGGPVQTDWSPTLGNMANSSRRCTEDGLIWDMVTELGALVRGESEMNPLRGVKGRKTFLTGYSQQGGFLVRYLNSFSAPIADETGHAPFDGYMLGGPGYICVPGLNQCEAPEKPGEEGTVVRRSPVPVLAVHTQTDNNRVGALECRLPDSDGPALLYRAYDVAGSSHDAKTTYLDYYRNDPDMEKLGIVPMFCGREPYPNDYPLELSFHACYEYLFRWAIQGVPAPRFSPIELDEHKENRTDDSGNVVGGMRLPSIDLPAAEYHDRSTPLKLGDYVMGSMGFGYKTPYTAEKLRERYGSLEEYKRQAAESARSLVESGMLLEADLDAAIAKAAEAFQGAMEE